MDKSFIVNALRKNGVQEGMCLEVHSSLKSFGHVEGGAEIVISALKESVGSEGTIFMPALRLSPALPLTDEDKKLGITCKIKILPDDRKKKRNGNYRRHFQASRRNSYRKRNHADFRLRKTRA